MIWHTATAVTLVESARRAPADMTCSFFAVQRDSGAGLAMATSEHGRRVSSHLLLISTLFIRALQFHPASAQQPYNNVTGFQCNGAAQTCQAFAYYRTQGTNSSLNSTAALFNVTAAAIANASSSSATTTALLPAMTALTVPLACGCYNGSYSALTTKSIEPGNTMYLIANNTFEGLVTFQAIEAANPGIVANNMRIGDKLRVPLRCACPTTAQVVAGTQSLLSYAVFPSETLASIGTKFNVTELELRTANSLPNNTVQAFTTVLVPLKGSASGSNGTGSPPAPAPSAACRGVQAHLLGVVSLLAVQAFVS